MQKDLKFSALSFSTLSFSLLVANIQESLKLAIEFNLYTYDAYFIQCAESMSCPLLTLNKRMQ